LTEEKYELAKAAHLSLMDNRDEETPLTQDERAIDGVYEYIAIIQTQEEGRLASVLWLSE